MAARACPCAWSPTRPKSSAGHTRARPGPDAPGQVSAGGRASARSAPRVPRSRVPGRAVRSESRPRLRRTVGQRGQLLRAQLGDRRRQPIRVAMARIPGDEHVPAEPIEMQAERIELLRAIRKPMKKDEGALGAMAVGVKARVTSGVDVGTVEVLEARDDLNSSFVRIAAHCRTGY